MKTKRALLWKKKRHTHKELIISHKSRKILYISKTYKGKEHGYPMLQKEFPCKIEWFKDLTVKLDSELYTY